MPMTIASGEPAADALWAQVLQRLHAATAGEFVIQRELGRGGFAAVFLAHEIALGRNVAIKVMSPVVMMGGGMVDRFLQEARTVASLNHPHIITIHSVRRLEELPYFVMKFVRGRSLEQVVRAEGPLPIPIVRAILFQVGSALGYAHRRGVIHRDVKPANILLDDEGNAIVTDFGIAKVAESPTHTVSGVVIGTLAYMSPEQCDAQPVGWTADQYSLGIVAYEMLTGSVPFTGSSYAVMQAHTEKPPPPIRARRPDCPPDLESAVIRMLAKDPRERWPTMRESLAALGAVALPDTDPLREELVRLARLDPSAHDDAPPPVPSPVPQVRTALAPAPIGTLSLVSIPGELEVGQAAVLGAAAWSPHGRPMAAEGLVWETSDASVLACESTEGRVRAISPGTATVTATAGGVRATSILTVLSPQRRHSRRWWAGAAGATVAIAGLAVLLTQRASRAAAVELSATRTALAPGDSAMLSAMVKNRRGVPIAGARVEWMTSNSAVVTVDSTGRMVARSPGTAQVIATRDDAVAIATITVAARADTIASGTILPPDTAIRSTARRTVLPVPLASIAIEPARLTLAIGDSQAVQAQALDSSRSPIDGYSFAWTSDNPSVARVSGPGTVLALKPGATTLRATAGGKTATLAVTVRARPSGVAMGRIAPSDTTSAGRETAAVTRPLAPEATNSTVAPDAAIQDLAAGGSLTCGALRAGPTLCWGSGQAGPVTIAGFTFKHVTAGEGHACGLTSTGEGYCWGANSRGQLGDGSTVDRPEPVPVKASQRFSMLSAGASHTCGIAVGGAAYCWGGNGSGQLGDGSQAPRTNPSAVHGSLDVTSIAAGGSHTCALTTGGKIFCWGDGLSGQLGNKAQANSTEPVQLETSSSFKAIAAGKRHTCALTVAGKAFCWGENASGQLGDESKDDRSWPQPVVLTVAFRAIAAGGAHTCGILNGGGLVCWGDNSSGQLGDGTRAIRLQPSPVAGGHSFATVSAGGEHTCGTTEDGRPLCWGSSSHGQTGNRAGSVQTVPTAVALSP
jgi:alpha-tubulin suppressor-like RCC1 family protein/uncharacterized protein YjdB